MLTVSLVAAPGYAVDMVDAARSGVPDDNTNGLMHMPMQAAFGLAVPASAGVAVLALADRAAGWWFAFMPAVVSSIWFGAVSIGYPDHIGSAGEVGGMRALAWGVALLAMAWATGITTQPGQVSQPVRATSGDRRP